MHAVLFFFLSLLYIYRTTLRFNTEQESYSHDSLDFCPPHDEIVLQGNVSKPLQVAGRNAPPVVYMKNGSGMRVSENEAIKDQACKVVRLIDEEQAEHESLVTEYKATLHQQQLQIDQLVKQQEVVAEDLAKSDLEKCKLEEALREERLWLQNKDQQLCDKDKHLCEKDTTLRTREEELRIMSKEQSDKDQELKAREQTLRAKEQEQKAKQEEQRVIEETRSTQQQEHTAKEQQLTATLEQYEKKHSELVVLASKLMTQIQKITEEKLATQNEFEQRLKKLEKRGEQVQPHQAHQDTITSSNGKRLCNNKVNG